MYKVRCKCGYIGHRRRDHVDSGRTTACRSCLSKNNAVIIEQLHKYRPEANPVGELDRSRFSRIRIGAERRNIDFLVSMEFIWELFISQDRRCKLTGLFLDFSDASLDRIDSSLGYTEANVQWVHKTVNTIKWNMSVEELVGWCSLIVDKHRSQK